MWKLQPNMKASVWTSSEGFFQVSLFFRGKSRNPFLRNLHRRGGWINLMSLRLTHVAPQTEIHFLEESLADWVYN